MSSEITIKMQSLLWWITSIAVSVLCCSVLFILFASQLIDVKASIEDNAVRLTALEARNDTMQKELDLVRKHNAAPAAAEAPSTTTETAPLQIIDPAPAPVAATPAPASTTPPAAAAPVPAINVPPAPEPVSVPSPEKK